MKTLTKLKNYLSGEDKVVKAGIRRYCELEFGQDADYKFYEMLRDYNAK